LRSEAWLGDWSGRRIEEGIALRMWLKMDGLGGWINWSSRRTEEEIALRKWLKMDGLGGWINWSVLVGLWREPGLILYAQATRTLLVNVGM